MRLFKIFTMVVGMIGLAFVLSGCDQTLPTIAFEQESVSVEVLDTFTLPTTILDSEEELTVLITIEDDTIVEQTETGFFAKAVGSTTVTATLEAYPEISATVTVTVTDLAENTFYLNYELDGGTLTGELPRKFTLEDLPVTLPVPTKTDKQFKGWFLDSEFTGNPITLLEGTFTEDVTLYAQWGEVITEADMEMLSNLNATLRTRIPENTRQSFTVPRSIFNFPDVEISWTSSKTSLITNSGFVLGEAYIFDFAIMTAAVTFKGETFTYNYRVNVLPISNTVAVDYNNKHIFAYYFDSSASLFNLDHADDIDYINYAFGGVSTTGYLAMPNMINFNSVLRLKEHGLKIVLSIGGWETGGSAGNMSRALATPAGRTKFTNSVMEAIINHGLAGVDIDWEFPLGATDNQNLASFLTELRTAMKAYDENLILTAAVSATTREYQVSVLNNVLDFIHIMTYDFSITGVGTPAIHHTNLYQADSMLYYGAGSVQQYINVGFTNRHKIIYGAAFYGRRMVVANNSTNGLRAIQSSAGAVNYDVIKSAYLSDTERYTRYWDDQAKAPWIYGVNALGENVFITYDDPESIMYKAQFVNEQNLGGMMFWQYAGDRTGELLEAIVEHLFVD